MEGIDDVVASEMEKNRDLAFSIPMHTLFLVEFFTPHVWWAETLFDNVVRGLIRQGNQVTVLTTKYNTQVPAFEIMEVEGWSVEVYRVWHNRFDFMRYGFRKGKQLLRDKRIDLIQTTTFNAAIPSAILRKLTHIPVVLHVHEIYVQLWYTFFGWKGFFYRRFEWLIFQCTFDHYTCSSLYTKNSLRLLFGIPDKKLSTTYCGIDDALWDETTVSDEQKHHLRSTYALDGSYVWVYFGRAGVAKGLLDYLRAVPLIVREIPSYKAFLIVPKQEKAHVGVIKATVSDDEVSTLIADLGIADHVVWIDSVRYTDLKQYLCMADVVVLPTMAEGFGLAIAEVCALQRPLVTTNVWSVPEVVWGTVALVEPANPTDIARGVVDIYTWKALSLPKKPFLREDCIERFISVYKHLWR